MTCSTAIYKARYGEFIGRKTCLIPLAGKYALPVFIARIVL